MDGVLKMGVTGKQRLMNGTKKELRSLVLEALEISDVPISSAEILNYVLSNEIYSFNKAEITNFIKNKMRNKVKILHGSQNRITKFQKKPPPI